mgnify:CR=1 FL=1
MTAYSDDDIPRGRDPSEAPGRAVRLFAVRRKGAHPHAFFGGYRIGRRGRPAPIWVEGADPRVAIWEDRATAALAMQELTKNGFPCCMHRWTDLDGRSMGHAPERAEPGEEA